jgi:hypothetical protein
MRRNDQERIHTYTEINSPMQTDLLSMLGQVVADDEAALELY